MIQSTDSLEAANYTQRGDILLKLSNLSEKRLTDEKLVASPKSPASKASDDHRKSPATKSVAAKVNDKLNDKLRERSIVKANERSAAEKSADRVSDRLTAKSTSDQPNDQANSKSNAKLNEKASEKPNEKLSEKSIDNLIDQRNKPATEKLLSSHKSNDKSIEDSKSGKRDCSHKSSLKSKETAKRKEKSAKKDSNIPNNQVHYPANRKRSDIENICDFNTIKRVKAEMSNSSRPLVFFGPSGSGKSTLLRELQKEFPEYFGFSVSHTTRKPREGEVHCQDYYFVTREEMLKAIQNDEFIEHTEFSGNIYGTSKKAIEDVRSKGKICILDIEIEGVKNVKKSHLNPVYIFIKPPTINELENRLRKRGSETEDSMQTRLKRAKDEIEFGEVKDNFDLLLVNDDFDSTYKKLKNFVLETYGLPDTSAEKSETTDAS